MLRDTTGFPAAACHGHGGCILRGKVIVGVGVRGMTFEYAYRWDSVVDDRVSFSRQTRPQRLVGGTALGCVALLCTWTLYTNLAGRDLSGQNLAAEDYVAQGFDQRDADQAEIAPRRGDRLDRVATRGDRLAVVQPSSDAAASSASGTLAWFDPRALGAAPENFVKRMFAGNPPPQAQRQAAAALPPAAHEIVQAAREVPPPRPASQVRTALLRDSHAEQAAENPPAEPGLFARLFGKPSPLSLAYASADDGVGSGGQGSGRYGAQTAVYDISAHTVYLPSGRRLEAHSGYGDLLDDPRHADVRMRGVTPPDVYDLTEREAPFHGVRALRLNPVDESKVFGRAGLLAHSYMLGPNGDSNGCVSFKDYDAFLQAYLNGEVKRLVVVAGRE